jgi:hypothetical protein
MAYPPQQQAGYPPQADYPPQAGFPPQAGYRIRLCVFRPSDGTWYIKGPGPQNWKQSHGNIQIQCGCAGDIPLAASLFGDGIRLCVFRPSNGTWYVKGPGPQNWEQSHGNIQIQCG